MKMSLKQWKIELKPAAGVKLNHYNSNIDIHPQHTLPGLHVLDNLTCVA